MNTTLSTKNTTNLDVSNITLNNFYIQESENVE